MKGWIRFNEDQTNEALQLIDRVNTCMGLPTSDGLSLTWQDGVSAYCTLDPQSAATQFWGTIVKIDTDQMGQCLTQSELNSIIQIPTDVYVCGTNL